MGLYALSALADCIIKGYVVFVPGSSGLAGDSLRYVRMLAGQGYVVLAPDGCAVESKLRTRDVVQVLDEEASSEYWAKNLLYHDDSAQGMLAYTSSSEGYLTRREHFARIYCKTLHLRVSELSYTLRHLPPFITRHGVFLFAVSEGAIALSAFDDSPCHHLIRGRVLAAYSCEPNYWNYDVEGAGMLKGHPSIPTLNLIGEDDQFFGAGKSIAVRVATTIAGRPPIAGHGFHTMCQVALQWGLVALLKGANHSMTLTHDAVIRELLTDFLERPQYACRELPSHWARLPRLKHEIVCAQASPSYKVMLVTLRAHKPVAAKVIV